MSDSVFHFRQFDIHQDHAAMKVGTDSDLLGTMAAGGRCILDVGTGTGVLALMMAQRFSEAHITAIEIDPQALIDARRNIDGSPFCQRVTLHHLSFQDYLTQQETPSFDSIVCNPPYFDRSLESPDSGRTRARHSSSLPFSVLAEGVFRLLADQGRFSVCIPPEVFDVFVRECRFAGLYVERLLSVKTLPHKPPKRFILVCKKGFVEQPEQQTFCLSNDDRTRSEWYKELMKPFLTI